MLTTHQRLCLTTHNILFKQTDVKQTDVFDRASRSSETQSLCVPYSQALRAHNFRKLKISLHRLSRLVVSRLWYIFCRCGREEGQKREDEDHFHFHYETSSCSTPPSTASIMSGEEEDEDYGALIYRESQLRKAEAAAAAVAVAAAKDAKKKKKNSSADVRTSTRRCATTTSTQATSTAHSKSPMNISLRKKASKKKRELSTKDEELAQKRARWREANQKNKKLCSADGCTNKAVKGGVCIKHGATVKRCSIE